MGTPSPVSVVPSFVKPPPGFTDLYQRYSETVYRAALRVTGNPADAEDVLQTVFLRMINNRVAPDPESPERYLRRAATNASIDLLRRKSTLSEIEIDEGRDYHSGQSTALLKERLRRALAKIPAEDARPFRPFFPQSFSFDEVGGQVPAPPGNKADRVAPHPAGPHNDLS